MTSEPQKFNFIDAFRGWAALGVVAIHSRAVSNPHDWLQPLLQGGERGVQLFFIISAFTLFYSLTNRFPIEKRPFAAFFVRRFFRIAPLFYAVMLVSIHLGSTGKVYWAPHGVSDLGVFLTAIFMNGWYPDFVNSVVFGGWSIAVEMNFYLLLPFLFMTVKRISVCLACLPAAYYAGVYLSKKIADIFRADYDQTTIYVLEAWQFTFNLLSEFYVFIFGILVFLLWHKCTWLFRVFTHATYLKIFYGLIFLFIVLLFNNPGMFSVVFMLSCIVLVGSAVNSPLTQGRAIRFLGKISYSIYFFHYFAMLYIGVLPGGTGYWLLGFMMILVLTIPAAFLGYTFIEKPFQNYGKKLIEKYIN